MSIFTVIVNSGATTKICVNGFCLYNVAKLTGLNNCTWKVLTVNYLNHGIFCNFVFFFGLWKFWKTLFRVIMPTDTNCRHRIIRVLVTKPMFCNLILTDKSMVTKKVDGIKESTDSSAVIEDEDGQGN